jgi:hypothetical protein
MSILSWGQPKIETTPSVSGEAPASAAWKELPVPKEDSTQLNPTKGTEKTATQEGGEIVDVRYGKTTFELVWENFVKKGEARPFEDEDGVIAGEHAFRITPEDDECEGILIDRSVVTCEESYTAADGKMLKYTAKCLKPKAGKAVKRYVANSSED